MKILKKVLLVIVGIVILALVVALFLKKDYAVEREVTINKPKQRYSSSLSTLKTRISTVYGTILTLP